MTQNTDVTAARDQLLADFNKVVSDTDVLLRSLVGVGGEKARAVRESVEMNLASTRERMRQLQASATEKTAAAARATDEYVHESPWTAIGVAAAAGLIVGVLLGTRR